MHPNWIAHSGQPADAVLELPGRPADYWTRHDGSCSPRVQPDVRGSPRRVRGRPGVAGGPGRNPGRTRPAAGRAGRQRRLQVRFRQRILRNGNRRLPRHFPAAGFEGGGGHHLQAGAAFRAAGGATRRRLDGQVGCPVAGPDDRFRLPSARRGNGVRRRPSAVRLRAQEDGPPKSPRDRYPS